MLLTLADVIQIAKEYGYSFRSEWGGFFFKPCYACRDNVCIIQVEDDDKIKFPHYMIQVAETFQFTPTMEFPRSLADITEQWLRNKFDSLDKDLDDIMQRYDTESQAHAVRSITGSQQVLETIIK